MRKHAPGYKCAYRAGFCVTCGKPEPMTFDGMEAAVEEQAKAAGVTQAEAMTAKLLEPLGDVSAKSGRIEEDSPLFYGKVNPTLF